MKRLDLKAIAESEVLRLTDERSIKNWCKKNGVDVFHDSKGFFVNELDFEWAYNLPFTIELQKKHPMEWHELYEHYNNNDMLNVFQFKMNQLTNPDDANIQQVCVNINSITSRTSHYEPKSNESIKRLDWFNGSKNSNKLQLNSIDYGK